MVLTITRKSLLSIILSYAATGLQLAPVKSSPRSISCGDLLANNSAQFSCDISQRVFAHNGQVGMIVNVTLKDLSVAGRHPDAPSLGKTEWRYFYTNDCTDRISRVPIKIGLLDDPGWSNGWLTCPIEHGGRFRKIIHNENMEPLFWIANIFF